MTEIEKDSPPENDHKLFKKIDILDVVGLDGLWQKCIFMVCTFYMIPICTQNLSISFLAPKIEHWCARPLGLNWTVEEWKILALPENDKQCSRFKEINLTHPLDDNGTIQRSDKTISCDSWEYDTSFYTSSVVSQLDLVCDKEWLISMSKSVYMAGNIVSNFVFGHISDSFGRKPAISICAFIALFSAVLCAFSTTVTMFLISRFLIALGISGVYNVAFVLLMEVIGPEYRSFYGIAINFGWCVGFVTLPGLAFVLRDWFWIQLALTIPCVVILGTCWLLPESPRWLLMKGRVDEAHEVLMKAATRNGKKISDADSKLRKIMLTTTEESSVPKGNFLELFTTSGLWQMTLNIYFLWFVNAFIYYGLSYNTNELAGNPFINFALSGAVEFPAYFITIFVISSMGRRNSTATSMIIGGIASLLVYPLPEEPVWIGVAVSMIGKFCITCSFAIIFVYTAELFPTSVRNLGLGTSSMFARFGSLIAPFVRELGDATHPILPQIIYGILAVVSGLLILLLPETNNVTVPDTVAEVAARRKVSATEPKKADHVTAILRKEENASNDLLYSPIVVQVPDENHENGAQSVVSSELEAHENVTTATSVKDKEAKEQDKSKANSSSSSANVGRNFLDKRPSKTNVNIEEFIDSSNCASKKDILDEKKTM